MAGVAPVPIQLANGMMQQYGEFQEFLEDVKLPPTIDRRDHPQDGSLHDITITTLSEFEQILNIFLEGQSRSN
jgi:hypothetical protein